MKTIALALTLVCVAASAQAGIIYTNLSGSITFNNGDNSLLTIMQSGPQNQELDFSAGSLPMIVNGTPDRTSAVVTLSYDATSTTPIGKIIQLVQGDAIGNGSISYLWTATANSGSLTLGSQAGTFNGAGLGGSNNAFNNVSVLGFSNGETLYHVNETFNMAAPAGSLAYLGRIEQNAEPVPEPASIAFLGLGGLGLVCRKRRA